MFMVSAHDTNHDRLVGKAVPSISRVSCSAMIGRLIDAASVCMTGAHVVKINRGKLYPFPNFGFTMQEHSRRHNRREEISFRLVLPRQLAKC
jgi:hypothetical protein